MKLQTCLYIYIYIYTHYIYYIYKLCLGFFFIETEIGKKQNHLLQPSSHYHSRVPQCHSFSMIEHLHRCWFHHWSLVSCSTLPENFFFFLISNLNHSSCSLRPLLLVLSLLSGRRGQFPTCFNLLSGGCRDAFFCFEIKLSRSTWL